MVWPCPCPISDSPPTCPPLTLLIKHDLNAPVYILLPSTRPDSCNGHRKVSIALPEPDRSRPTRTAITLLFPIGRVPFFSGLLGPDPCASAFPRSGVRSHQTLGALQSRSLRPPNPLCSPSRLARRTGCNKNPDMGPSWRTNPSLKGLVNTITIQVLQAVQISTTSTCNRQIPNYQFQGELTLSPRETQSNLLLN